MTQASEAATSGIAGAPPAPADLGVSVTAPKSHSTHRMICGLEAGALSRAISFARIILIIGLVCVHYDHFPNLTTELTDGASIHSHFVATWLGSAVLYFFYSVVPMLSMVSGWLFFSFKPEDAWSSIKRRMKKRFVSLYLPLVAWNAFFALCIYAFYLGYPHSAFFNELEFTIPFPTWMDFVNAVFGITHRPIGFQFWFVRDLFVTALISPVLWLTMRYAPWLGVLALGVCWLRHTHMVIFWRADVPFFFYLGAMIRQRNVNISVPLKLAIACMAAYVVLASLRALAPIVVDEHIHFQGWALDKATSMMRLVGVVSCWGLMYRMAQTRIGESIGNYGGLAFFLHSAHWPMLVVLKMWLWPLMPGDTDAAMLLHYLLSVALTVTIGLGVGKALATWTPRFFSLMNGGRLLKQTTS